MARPRAFEESEVVEQALAAFWQAGYGATSIADLERATGCSRISLYSAFGDKEGLFLRVLDLYLERTLGFFAALLEGRGLDGIEALLSWCAAPPPGGRAAADGCLILNTMLTWADAPPSVRTRAERYRAGQVSGLRAALEREVARGGMRATPAELADRAEFLRGVLWGAVATARFDGDRASLAPMIAVARQVVAGWRTGPG